MSTPPPRLSLDQVRQDGLVELAAAAAAVSSISSSSASTSISTSSAAASLDLFSLDLRGLEQQFARAAKMSAAQLLEALASATSSTPTFDGASIDRDENSRNDAAAATAMDVLRVYRAAAGCRAALREQAEVIVAIGA